jgi:cell division ATPase FtsA
LSGFKKLIGSEILKENITYILNSLKSTIDDIEDQKKILHIFNSKFLLDKQETQNLPIGLHGNFYSHELSFNLMDNNDYKDLSNIFKKCNLKIKKILMKNFVKGAFTSNQNSNLNTFFQIEIHKKNSRIFYFENDALKFEQRFNFGSDIVLDDISKITNLNRDIIIKILQASLFTQNKLVQDLVEKKFFEGKNYRKIKKNLLFEIATARIQELSKIILLNNINLKSYIKRETKVFLIITDLYNFECLKENFIASLSDNDFFKVLYKERISTKDLIYSASDLVNFGWKKEAVPIIHPKKSIIAKFFDAIFS